MMNCDREVATTTTTTIARISESGDDGGGDDANFRPSVRKRSRKRCRMSGGKATQQENSEVPGQGRCV
jgi:hypothetical protein